MSNKLYWLAFIFLTQSCTSHLSHKFNIRKFEEEPKSVVAIGIKYFEKGLFWNNEKSVSFNFAKVEPSYFSDKKKTYHKSFPGIMMLEPGTYVIENIEFTSGDVTYYSTLPGLNAVGGVTYGAITVEAGKLYDAGQLWITTNMKIVQEISDNKTSEAKLKKLDPSFSNKPVEKLELIPAKSKVPAK